MTDILEEVRLIIPARRRNSPSGWINVCCPACGDRRYRGGFNFTPSGGFRYFCFNGGCEYDTRPTGWEPGNGFGGRPRRLFELFGGDVKRIPLKELMKWNATKYSTSGDAENEEEELDVVWQFPEVSLPPGSEPLMDVYKQSLSANKVMQYAVSRVGEFVKNLPFYWSPEHPYHLLIPYLHYKNKIVGYLGRHIYRDYGKRFIQHAPNDYLFNQHLISSYNARYLFVVESPLDALLLGCVASRGDRLTDRQANLLRTSGKEIVLIPDRKQGEWEGYLELAEKQNWFVSIPRWTGETNPESEKLSDISHSFRQNGLLFTIETVMQHTTRNFTRAVIEMNQRNIRST